MHNKGLIIGVSVLAGSLMLTEIAESAGCEERCDYPIHSGFTSALVPAAPANPHTHFEAEGEFANTTNPYFASGGQHVAGGYELMLNPHLSINDVGQNAIAWIDAVGVPDGLSGSQQMFARFESLDELATALAKIPEHFPGARIASIREALSKGPTKIGGSRAPVRFFFSEAQLFELGMSFRPLDG